MEQHNAENCLYNGRKLLGYRGQKNAKYEIDPDTAPVVQKIYRDYADGIGMQKIIEELNNAGFRSMYGRPFTINSIRGILHNRAYLGEYRYGEVLIPDGMPRIISNELFERVQERLTHNSRGGRPTVYVCEKKPDFWLTGHIFCGYCGSTVSGTSGTGRHGERHHYYMCVNKKRKKKPNGCAKENVRKDVVEGIITDVLYEILNNPLIRIIIGKQVYEFYRRQHGSNDNYQHSLENKIKDAEKAINNIMKAIEAGIFNETTQGRMLELHQQKSMLTDELSAERLREQYSLKEEQVIKYLESFTGNLDDVEVRRRVFDLLINKIILSDDKIVVTFNFSDDRREFDIAEMMQIIKSRERIMDILCNYKGMVYNEETNEKEGLFIDGLMPALDDFFV